ncbi:hypothetical protein ABKN59_010756 [Abortiporus biennis]
MDANELGRWTRFAAKGGIGRGTAIQDCVAEEPGDLMFLKDDEITVLMQLPGQDDLYLGYCEGVVGRFKGASVRFNGKLKKPVMTKRSSTAPNSRPSSSMSAATLVASVNSTSASSSINGRESSLSLAARQRSSPSLRASRSTSFSSNRGVNTLGSLSSTTTLVAPTVDSPSLKAKVLHPTSSSPGAGHVPLPMTQQHLVHPSISSSSGSRLSHPSSTSYSSSSLSFSTPPVTPPSQYQSFDLDPSERFMFKTGAGGGSFAEGVEVIKTSVKEDKETVRIVSPERQVRSPSLIEHLEGDDKDDDEEDTTIITQEPVSDTAKPATQTTILASQSSDQPSIALQTNRASVISTSSLYPDSLRDSIHSAFNLNLNLTQSSEPNTTITSSFFDSETTQTPNSHRISTLSGISNNSDGEVGIGMKFLQNFVNGGGGGFDSDDSDEVREVKDDGESSASAYDTPPPRSAELVNSNPSSPQSPPASRPSGSSPKMNGSSSNATGSSSLSLPNSPTSPSLQPPLQSQAHSPPPASHRSTSIHSSTTDPEYEDGEEAGYWDGASDIFDNYRYSRVSLASKMSRLSRGSVFTTASSAGIVPPIPLGDRRPSIDSIGRGSSNNGFIGGTRSRLGSEAGVRPSFASSNGTGSGGSSPVIENASTAIKEKDVIRDPKKPAPLTIPPSISARIISSQGQSAVEESPLTGSAGVASAIRQRLELELELETVAAGVAHLNAGLNAENTPGLGSTTGAGGGLMVPMNERRARLSTQPIVQEDDEAPAEGVELVVPNLESNSTVTTPMPTSTTFEKETIQSTVYNSDSAPAPPPYSPTAEVFTMLSEQIHHRSNPTSPISPSSGSSSPIGSNPVITAPPSSSTLTIRPLNINRQPPSPSARQSLFLPHPGAPPPRTHNETTGPIYNRPPSQHLLLSAFSSPTSPPSSSSSSYPSPHMSPPVATGPQQGSVMYTLQLVLSIRARNMGMGLGPTLYGKCEVDLATSIGPVPISFTLEPPQNIPANNIALRNQIQRSQSPAVSLGGSGSGGSRPGTPAQQSALPVENGHVDGEGSGVDGRSSKVIPRANFFPKVQTPRPRSRSFSGFDSTAVEIELTKESSSQEPQTTITTSASMSSLSNTALPLAKRSKSASATVNGVPKTNSLAGRTHAPSPLSLSRNIVVASPTSLSPKPPSSPLAKSSITVPSSPPASPTRSNSSDDKPLTREMALGQASSQISQSPEPPTSPFATTRPLNISPRSKRDTDLASVNEIPTSESAPTFSSVPAHYTPSLRHSRSNISHRSKSSLSGRGSSETDDRRSVVSPTPNSLGGGLLRRSSSLKNKLSLPTLRIRATSDKSVSIEEKSPTLSVTPSEQLSRGMVQVKDTDFELVKPSLSAPLSPSTDELTIPPLPSPIKSEGPHSLRAGSPALSTISGSSARSRPPIPAMGQQPQLPPTTHEISPPTTKTLDPVDVEAHRQRELKWISTMTSIPASQARKSKKVRKLLQEGVPASVRYLVWAHLTDSKSKRMDGLYVKLGKRERVAASLAIEKDVDTHFGDYPQLQDGSLVNLLQAYLTMVPDIQYCRGLASIAGCLLLQSPEEDAFWTFISLMNTHLRSYFSTTAVQLEVDASLFAKAVEANEPTIAKRLFVDMGIPPVDICRPWFSALFVDALPSEYMQRVWDIFLFEGVPFLFRVGLALLSCCKSRILSPPSMTGGVAQLLPFLAHPPSNVLPSTPDALVDLALGVKLKDEDLKKQRNKMEAQVKRQTQSVTRVGSGAGGVKGPSISLPKS